MQKVVIIPLPEASEALSKLKLFGCKSKDYEPFKKDGNLVIPVSEDTRIEEVFKIVVDIPKEQIQIKNRKKNDSVGYSAGMKAKSIYEQDFESVLPSVDIIGKMAIIEVAEELLWRKHEIARAVADYFQKRGRGVESVFRKVKGRDKESRTITHEYLWGIDRRSTVHIENGVKIALNIDNMFFSGRLSQERRRIAELVKDAELVLVPFCGCGPFLLIVGKYSPAREIIGMELNSHAFQFCCENIVTNNIRNATVFHGDVRKLQTVANNRFVDTLNNSNLLDSNAKSICINLANQADLEALRTVKTITSDVIGRIRHVYIPKSASFGIQDVQAVASMVKNVICDDISSIRRPIPKNVELFHDISEDLGNTSVVGLPRSFFARASKVQELSSLSIEEFVTRALEEGKRIILRIDVSPGIIRHSLPTSRSLEIFYDVPPPDRIEFDRLVVPTPKGDGYLLESVIGHCKRPSMIHFYWFANPLELATTVESISGYLRELDKFPKFTVECATKCGRIGPRMYRYCFDIKVE